jgi:hypothetical protein
MDLAARLSIRNAALACLACTLVLAPAAQAAEEVPPQFNINGKLVPSTGSVPVTLWGELKLATKGGVPVTCHDVMSASVWNEGGRGVGEIEGLGAPRCEYNPPLEGCAQGICAKAFETGELPFALESREAEVCSEILKTELSKCPSAAERTIEVLTLHLRRRVGLPWKLRLIREVREEEPAIVAEIGLPPGGQTCYPKELVAGKEVAAQWEKAPAGCIRMTVLLEEAGTDVEVVVYGVLKPRLVNGAGNGLNASRLEFGPSAGLLVPSNGEAPETEASGTVKLSGSEARELITAK